MGEIAEDIMSGRCCMGCGAYFEEEHEYPVLCKHCWNAVTPDIRRRTGASRATNKLLGDDDGPTP